MAEHKNEQSSALSNAASAAGMARAAAKTGKALSGVAKGASAGPYGMLAAGLWEGRHLIAKVAAVLCALLLLPVAYIMMLPSLIFGNGGLDAASAEVLTDNGVIMGNLSEAEGAIEEVLQKKHDAMINRIRREGSRLGKNCEYGITDDFSDHVSFESALIISEFCASTGNYREINLKQLKKLLNVKAENIFSYSVMVTEREKTNEKMHKKCTIKHYEYTVSYAGDDYYADAVFELTPYQKTLAAEYAKNLLLFLNDESKNK